MEEATRTQKIKDHFKKHKGVYIGVGVGVTVGVAGTLLVCSGNSGNQAVQKVTALKTGDITQNVVQVQMTRPGPKSFVVQCIETQGTWPSIRQATKDMGLNASDISQHLKGARDTVGGFTFIKLDEL